MSISYDNMGSQTKLGAQSSKMKIPTLNGSMWLTDILDWILVVEEFFEHYKIPTAKQVTLVEARLKGTTRTWCTTYRHRGSHLRRS